MALLAVVVSTTGCATKGDLRSVEAQISTLAARQDEVLAELQRQGRVTADTLRGQSDQLVDMRGNLSQQLRTIVAQLEQLEEMVGQNQRGLASIRDRMEAAGRTPVRPPPATGEGQRSGDELVGPEGSVEAAQTKYDEANRHFNRGSLVAARYGFEQYLQQHPNDELAPTAHYRLGDILVQQDSLDAAVEKFLEIRALYPDDAMVPRALYRVGVLHLEMEDEEEARRFFDTVINSYPESSSAELAQDRLDEIGG